MKVSIKDLSVDMEIKNNGVELDVFQGKGAGAGEAPRRRRPAL